MTIILAILLGLAFGIALDQAKASNPQKIIGMLRLKVQFVSRRQTLQDTDR